MKKYLVLVFVLFLFHSHSFAQEWNLEVSSSVELRTLKLTNKAEKQSRPIGGASVVLTQGSTIVKQVTTDGNGDFVIQIPQNGEFLLTISYKDCNPKKFFVSTKGLPADFSKDNQTPEFPIGGVIMAKPLPSIDYAALKNPMAKIMFIPSERKIDDDENYTDQILGQLERIKKAEDDLIERFLEAVNAGDKALKKPDCPLAKQMYEKALSLIPNEEYPIEQLKKVGDCLKEKENTAKKEAEAIAAKAAAEKAAADKALADKAAKEKAEAEKLAAEKANKAKADAEAAAKKQAEELAAKAAAEKATADKALADKVAKEKAEAEKLAAEKANKVKADAEAAAKKQADELAAKAAAEKAAADKALADKAAKEKAEAEKLATEKANKDKTDAEAAAKKQADELAAKAAAAKALAEKAEAETKTKAENEALAKKQSEEAAAKAAEEKALADKKNKEAAELAAKAKQDALAKKAAEDKAKKLAADKIAKAKAESEAKALAQKQADEAAAKEEADRVAKAKAEQEKPVVTPVEVEQPKEEKPIASESEPVKKELKIVGGQPYEPKSSDPSIKGKDVKFSVPQTVIGGNKYKEIVKRADDLFKTKRYEEAKPAYEEALKLKPDDAHATARLEAIAKLLPAK